MNKKLIIAIVLILIAAAGFGLGVYFYKNTGIADFVEKKRTESSESNVVASINDYNLTVDECRVYIAALTNQIESIYGNEIWNYKLDTEGTSYEEMMKKSLLEKLIYIKLVCSMADDVGVSLDSNDTVNINGYVADFFAGISEDTAENYGLTTDLITEIYKDNVLARKVYDSLTLNYDVNATTENCRQGDFIRIFIKKYRIKEDGEYIYYAGDELADVYDRAKAAREEAAAGNFADVAARYDESGQTEITLGADALTEETASVVMGLKEGEISEVLDTDDYYCIYYCVSSYNADATALRVQAATAEGRDEYFRNLYDEWYADADIRIDNDKWYELEF